jgi:hypothetical protein
VQHEGPKEVQGWWHFAKCKGMDPEVFITDSLSGERKQKKRSEVDRARNICKNCLVKYECLAAYCTPELINEKVVAGGLTQRRRVKFLHQNPGLLEQVLEDRKANVIITEAG